MCVYCVCVYIFIHTQYTHVHNILNYIQYTIQLCYIRYIGMLCVIYIYIYIHTYIHVTYLYNIHATAVVMG